MEPVPVLDKRRAERLGPEERAVFDRVLVEEMARRQWYHIIDFGNGVLSPGRDVLKPTWEMIRQVRRDMSYLGKSVVDIGSWDGMWCFEAEALGASLVVATDCMHHCHGLFSRGFDNFLLAREHLFSAVIPFWNVAPSNLRERLNALLFADPRLTQGFDIVQHLGVLYHLRDPMLSLAQARSVLRTGGTLLLETAFHQTEDRASMWFNAGRSEIYPDYSTWWAPSLRCLKEMLETSLFEVDDSSIRFVDVDGPAGRVALRAKARAPERSVAEHYTIDPAFNHGFGDEVARLIPPPTKEMYRKNNEELFGKEE
ncbi:tRNA (mo5U34)-methyltransferase [Planctomycetes bacterium Pan216]|uniref:tRNA (Mo5U34)-methyltransferase n=1 Tax=Kolteria novifilia TaxID=2527975 RepID=A0A518B9D5_9BACT|nr:tRNA (mo5U34)-methyltransferase [Planctomycetes bacterium Pan216]